MAKNENSIPAGDRASLPLKWLIALFVLGAAATVALAAFFEASADRLRLASAAAARSDAVLALVQEVFALVLDAQSGHRGYLLTGRKVYLEQYSAALPMIDKQFQRFRAQTIEAGDGEQIERASRMNNLIAQIVATMAVSLALVEKQGREAAAPLLEEDIGRKLTDELRANVEAFDRAERLTAATRTAKWERDVELARAGMAFATLFDVLLLAFIFALIIRDARRRERVRAELVKHKDQLEAIVADRTAALQRAYRDLQEVREDEKSKLARDIHDELGSILVALKMDASWIERRLERAEPGVADKLGRMLNTLDEGVAIKRRLIEELRPSILDNLGLGAALEWQANEVCRRANLRCHVKIPENELSIGKEITIALFRIVQEALTNVQRYANAKNLWLELAAAPGGVRLSIRDDGVGLSDGVVESKLSHGILGMRERVISLGGEFNIHSMPGSGTTIDIYVPSRPEIQSGETAPLVSETARGDPI
jgi:signal transduction histidine kinase